MTIFVTILHVIMCLILIAIVLLQTGKGSSMGAAFGGASNTIFGGAGPASFLNKITTIAAVMFMITSFTLAVLSTQGGTSSRVLDATPVEQTEPASEEGTAAPEESATPQERDSATITDDSEEGSAVPEESATPQERDSVPITDDSGEDNQTTD